MYQDLIYELAEINRFTEVTGKKGVLVDPNQSLDCQDSIQVSLNTQPTISNIQLDLRGCVLSKASINSLCLAIEHKNREEGIRIIDNFLNMVAGNEFEEEILDENLRLFEKFKSSLSRRACLTGGAIELKKALEI